MIDIEEEYQKELKRASKSLSDDIDFTVISQYLVEDGWTKVTVNRFTDNHHAIDIRHWIEENFGSEGIASRGSTFLFKNPKHATLFMLRWGGEL